MLNSNLDHESEAILPANIAKNSKPLKSNPTIEDGNIEQNSESLVTSTTLINRVKDEIIQLTKLPQGWDGYHGVPLELKTAEFAQSLADKYLVKPLPKPVIIPGCDSSVQFAWHNCGSDIELSIYSPKECYGWRLYKSSNEEEISFDGTNGEKFNSRISKWLEELSLDWINSEK